MVRKERDEECPCDSCATTSKTGILQVITLLLLTVALGGGFWGIGKTSAQESEIGEQEKKIALLEQSQMENKEALKEILRKIDKVDQGVTDMDKKLEVHIAKSTGRASQ